MDRPVEVACSVLGGVGGDVECGYAVRLEVIGRLRMRVSLGGFELRRRTHMLGMGTFRICVLLRGNDDARVGYTQCRRRHCVFLHKRIGSVIAPNSQHNTYCIWMHTSRVYLHISFPYCQVNLVALDLIEFHLHFRVDRWGGVSVA